jgi:predicted transcriptional regulator
MWGLLGIGMIATGLAVAGLIGGEFLFTAILFGMVGLIARWRKEKVLDHFVRGQIFGAIQRDPGITYSDIRKLLQVANGELAYHLHTLEREGFVKSVRDGKYRRYYAIEAKVPKLTGIRVSTVQSRILDYIKAHQGCSQSDVARAQGMNLRTVNYNVQQLRRAGLVSIKVEGGRSHLYATGEERAVSTPAPAGIGTGAKPAHSQAPPAGAAFRPAGAGAAVSPSGKAVGARAAAKALAQKRAASRQIDIDRTAARPAASPPTEPGAPPGGPPPGPAP